MIRNIVGTLLPVGVGKNAPQWVGEVLQSRNRCKAGITAPAQGLYFVDAQYSYEYALPAVDLNKRGLW